VIVFSIAAAYDFIVNGSNTCTAARFLVKFATSVNCHIVTVLALFNKFILNVQQRPLAFRRCTKSDHVSQRFNFVVDDTDMTLSLFYKHIVLMRVVQ
jgi:hypothetical protein